MTWAGRALILVLSAFSLRRLVFLAAGLLPAPRTSPSGASGPPTVSVIVPARDEAAVVDSLLASLAELRYTGGLSFLLVCDGCSDVTPERFRRWAAGRDDTAVVELSERVGKASALNAGLAAAPASEVVIALDADLRPRPDFVERLVEPFADPRVAAVAGLRLPANANDGVVARYAALNDLVHQLVTSAAKDRLRLNPPTLGAAAYRRDALVAVGGFAPPLLAEDVEVALALTRAGWLTRFAPDAVADNDVTATLRDYWRQRIRWTRSTLESRNRRPVPQRAPLHRRVEAAMVVVGNADRPVALAAAGAALAGLLPRWVPAAYFALPAADIAVALGRAGGARDAPRFALAAALMLPVDVAAATLAVVLVAAGRRPEWHSARRAVAS